VPAGKLHELLNRQVTEFGGAPPARSGPPVGPSTLYVELYGTGILGAHIVQCFVAGQSVPVQSAGPSSYPGLDQVNIAIPQSLGGAGTVLVYLVGDGVASNVVSLTLQ